MTLARFRKRSIAWLSDDDGSSEYWLLTTVRRKITWMSLLRICSIALLVLLIPSTLRRAEVIRTGFFASFFEGKALFATTAGSKRKRRPPRKNSSHYFKLPAPNPLLPAVSLGGCCGIGHRLTRNLPAMIYGINRRRRIHMNYIDVKWRELFHDTENIIDGPRTPDFHGNGFPRDWHLNTTSLVSSRPPMPAGTAHDRYDSVQRQLFHMPIAHSIAKALSESLSPLVLSFLLPLRSQYATQYNTLHLCSHIREGNNESGDWKGKTWRHIDTHHTSNSTLSSMMAFAKGRGATRGTIFVASDNSDVRPWFEQHAPVGWKVVAPTKFLPRPETGVWFGEHGSKTNLVLNATQKNEAMAEAVADVFALGECDGLWIPNYSSFTLLSIILARADNTSVFFKYQGLNDVFVEI